MLLVEADQPLCLYCARLGGLEFLPAGDTALTRRYTKYTERIAVVVRFKRYERQGILVEEAALAKAEQECVQDADERAAARACTSVLRGQQDRKLVAQMIKLMAELFPGCSSTEIAAIAEHTAVRGSGRVGRSESGRNLNETALTLAVGAAVRHNHTSYDELLASGVDRADARQQIAGQVEEILAKWRR